MHPIMAFNACTAIAKLKALLNTLVIAVKCKTLITTNMGKCIRVGKYVDNIEANFVAIDAKIFATSDFVNLVTNIQ